MKATRQLTAIIEREADSYVALCPELDIASQGDTVESARTNLIEALELFFESADPTEVARRLHSGTPVAVTTLDSNAGETSHAFPFFLPDGRHFLYVAYNSFVPLGVSVGSLDSQERRRLLDGASNAQYAAGSLIFPRGST